LCAYRFGEELGARRGVVEGEGATRGATRPSRCRSHRFPVHRRSDDERHRALRALGEWLVHLRSHDLAHPVLLLVTDDSDNGHPRIGVLREAELYPLAAWIRAGEKLARERGVVQRPGAPPLT